MFAANCLLAGVTQQVQANSYASSLTNNAGEVSFRLNDAADSVKIVGNSGALTLDLGALPRGLTVTNLASLGLTAGNFSVVVVKNETGSPALIGGSVPFNSPRGVTVNQNPTSPYFGWVDVANSAGNAVMGDGMFAFSADLSDILGQGITPKTGGLNFATGTTSSPYRPKVGRNDNNVYIADWSDGSGNLYMMTPTLEAPAGGAFALKPLTGTAAVPVGLDNNHGSVAAVEVLGSVATSDLRIFTVDEDLQTDREQTALNEMNSLWRYDVGAGPLPWGEVPAAKLNGAPINFVSQVMDLSYSPGSGYLYMSDQRSAGNEPGVHVVDQDGNRLFDSKLASVALGNATDFLNNLQGVTASTDGKWLAVVHNNNVVTIVPMVDGIPDLARRFQYTGFGTTISARGISFDRANNLYVVSSGLGFLQSLSIGLTATNTTSSDGTFTQQTAPLQTTTVSVAVGNAAISEGDTATVGSYTITRASENLTTPSVVNFTLGGTATRGASDTTGDYFIRVNGTTVATANSVTIPANETQITVEVVANNDNISEASKTVTLALAAGAYQAVPPLSGTVTITDNDPAMIEISAVNFNRMFEGNPFDRLRFTLQRLGDPSLGPIEVNLTYSGTATSGTDYTPINSVIFEATDLTKTFDVLVAADTAIEPVETVTVAVATGSGYLVGTNNVLTAGASGVIVDDDLPAETVLFGESFNTDVSPSWTVFGASASGVDDYTATFGYNYADLNVPAAPHSAAGDTFGLLMSANKLDATLEAAAVNAYANGKDFSGNYAVRFDMYIMQNNTAGTTEHAMFGLNHSGAQTNWFSNAAGVPAGWTFDGIFAAVIADASNLGDYLLFTAPRAAAIPGPTTVASRTASTLTDVFHQPPWTAGSGAGSPGNTPATTTPSWAQVELRHENGIVTLSINATNIFSYTNSTTSTHGTIMLGYADTFNSIGSGGGGLVIYDNLRVVSLGSAPVAEVRITTTTRVANNLQIDFTAGSSDTTANFKVATATTVTGPYADDNSITVTQVSPGVFRASVPIDSGNRFVQIHRLP